MSSKKNTRPPISCKVRLLNEEECLEIKIQKDDTGKRLLDLVCADLSIIETDFFGLRYIDAEGNRQWIDGAKSVYKQLKGNKAPNAVFSLRVRYYPANIDVMKEEITRYHVYMQLRRDAHHGRLHVAGKSQLLPQLCSYILQSELGDYEDQILDVGYTEDIKLLPQLASKVEDRITKEYRSLPSGMTPSEAEYEYIKHAIRLDSYGTDPYPARDLTENVAVHLAVSHPGVSVFISFRRVKLYRWSSIMKTTVDGKTLHIHAVFMDSKIKHTKYKFHSEGAAHSFWILLQDQQAFFTLTTSDEAHKTKSSANPFRRSSSFRFSGRVLSEVSLTEVKRKQPSFLRSSTLSLNRSILIKNKRDSLLLNQTDPVISHTKSAISLHGGDQALTTPKTENAQSVEKMDEPLDEENSNYLSSTQPKSPDAIDGSIMSQSTDSGSRNHVNGSSDSIKYGSIDDIVRTLELKEGDSMILSTEDLNSPEEFVPRPLAGRTYSNEELEIIVNDSEKQAIQEDVLTAIQDSTVLHSTPKEKKTQTRQPIIKEDTIQDLGIHAAHAQQFSPNQELFAVRKVESNGVVIEEEVVEIKQVAVEKTQPSDPAKDKADGTTPSKPKPKRRAVVVEEPIQAIKTPKQIVPEPDSVLKPSDTVAPQKSAEKSFSVSDVPAMTTALPSADLSLLESSAKSTQFAVEAETAEPSISQPVQLVDVATALDGKSVRTSEIPQVSSHSMGRESDALAFGTPEVSISEDAVPAEHVASAQNALASLDRTSEPVYQTSGSVVVELVGDASTTSKTFSVSSTEPYHSAPDQSSAFHVQSVSKNEKKKPEGSDGSDMELEDVLATQDDPNTDKKIGVENGMSSAVPGNISCQPETQNFEANLAADDLYTEPLQTTDSFASNEGRINPPDSPEQIFPVRQAVQKTPQQICPASTKPAENGINQSLRVPINAPVESHCSNPPSRSPVCESVQPATVKPSCAAPMGDEKSADPATLISSSNADDTQLPSDMLILQNTTPEVVFKHADAEKVHVDEPIQIYDLSSSKDIVGKSGSSPGLSPESDVRKSSSDAPIGGSANASPEQYAGIDVLVSKTGQSLESSPTDEPKQIYDAPSSEAVVKGESDASAGLSPECVSSFIDASQPLTPYGSGISGSDLILRDEQAGFEADESGFEKFSSDARISGSTETSPEQCTDIDVPVHTNGPDVIVINETTENAPDHDISNDSKPVEFGVKEGTCTEAPHCPNTHQNGHDTLKSDPIERPQTEETRECITAESFSKQSLKPSTPEPIDNNLAEPVAQQLSEPITAETVIKQSHEPSFAEPIETHPTNSEINPEQVNRVERIQDRAQATGTLVIEDLEIQNDERKENPTVVTSKLISGPPEFVADAPEGELLNSTKSYLPISEGEKTSRPTDVDDSESGTKLANYKPTEELASLTKTDGEQSLGEDENLPSAQKSVDLEAINTSLMEAFESDSPVEISPKPTQSAKRQSRKKKKSEETEDKPVKEASVVEPGSITLESSPTDEPIQIYGVPSSEAVVKEQSDANAGLSPGCVSSLTDAFQSPTQNGCSISGSDLVLKSERAGSEAAENGVRKSSLDAPISGSASTSPEQCADIYVTVPTDGPGVAAINATAENSHDDVILNDPELLKNRTKEVTSTRASHCPDIHQDGTESSKSHLIESEKTSKPADVDDFKFVNELANEKPNEEQASLANIADGNVPAVAQESVDLETTNTSITETSESNSPVETYPKPTKSGKKQSRKKRTSKEKKDKLVQEVLVVDPVYTAPGSPPASEPSSGALHEAAENKNSNNSDRSVPDIPDEYEVVQTGVAEPELKQEPISKSSKKNGKKKSPNQSLKTSTEEIATPVNPGEIDVTPVKKDVTPVETQSPPQETVAPTDPEPVLEGKLPEVRDVGQNIVNQTDTNGTKPEKSPSQPKTSKSRKNKMNTDQAEPPKTIKPVDSLVKPSLNPNYAMYGIGALIAIVVAIILLYSQS